MKKTGLAALAASMICISLGAFDIIPAQKSDYAIVMDLELATETEKKTAEILQQYLREMFPGCTFSVTDQNIAVDGSAIYLGNTQRAKSEGIDFSALQPEEIILKTSGDDLILTGGAERGIVYAVYDFLEKYCNVDYYAPKALHIPTPESLHLDEVNLRRIPVIPFRQLFAEWSAPDYFLFNKANLHWLDRKKFGPFGCSVGSPRAVHSLLNYSQMFPLDRPELFAEIKGRRVVPSVAGTSAPLCLSNPETRTLVTQLMLKSIAQDRQKSAAENLPPPALYDLSLDDTLARCECEKCSKLFEQEESYAGVMLDFVNAVAAEIVKSYPDIKITTLAYQLTQAFPKTIRPLPNVVPWICAHDENPFGFIASDTSKSLKADRNRTFYENIKKWDAASEQVAFWDYWNYYAKPLFPMVAVDKYFDNIRLFADSHAVSVMIEHEHYDNSFYAFRCYVALKLMDDPYQDKEQLIGDFFQGYYGKAAPLMREYLNLLDAVTASEDQLGALHPKFYQHLSVDFFNQAYRLLEQAAVAADTPAAKKHVEFELVALDQGALIYWDKMASEMPFSREELLTRLARNKQVLIQEYYEGAQLAAEYDKLERMLKRESLVAPLPPQIKGDYVVDYKWPDFKPLLHNGQEYTRHVDDPDAVGGRALEFVERKLDLKIFGREYHTLPFTVLQFRGREFGPRTDLDTVAQDEKYHLYPIGRWDIQNGNRISFQWSSHEFGVPDAALPPPDNVFDAYVSLKFTGPAYVPGSTSPNGVFLDRVILSKITE